MVLWLLKNEGIQLLLPPLRERKEDIPLLANHFLQKFIEKNHKNISHISPEALEILIQYPWPGNVRELENTIERAVIFSIRPIILPEDLPQKLLESASVREREKLEKNLLSIQKNFWPLKAIEKSYVLRVLEETKGD